jgi:mycothione reductase
MVDQHDGTDRHDGTVRRYDLIIVGAGSGNMLVSDDLAHWRIAVVEADRFGGTCLNRGCIPSKMLVHTANVAETVRRAGRFGIGAAWVEADWPAIRDRVFGRIDPLHDAAVAYRRTNGVDVFLGQARFVAPKTLRVGEEVLSAERFVLAAGSRPHIPAISGLSEVDYLTSDTVMRIDVLPESMVIVGGGFIAAEMGHIFGALGVAVTIVERGPALLSRHDHDISTAFTDACRSRFDLRLGTTVESVAPCRSGLRFELIGPDGRDTLEAATLLVATGRVPNSDRLDVAAAGIATDEHGHVRTDSAYQTNVAGVFALGDLANHFQLKHMANAEARLVRHNLLHPTEQHNGPFSVVPAAVFADPQVASVGATEQALRAAGRPYVAATRRYSDTAYGWALEDTTGFVKVLADPETRLLLGAHILGPQASTLIQPLVQAMCLGNTADEVATAVLYIHPALSEAVEQALLAL